MKDKKGGDVFYFLTIAYIKYRSTMNDDIN